MLCDWLPPDFGAVGQYALQHATELAQKGHQVCLVGFSSTATKREIVRFDQGTLTIRRLLTPVYDRSALIGRAMWTLKANFSLLREAGPDMLAADEIQFTGSPPYLLHFIAWFSGKLKAQLRYRITDFHPECLIAAMGRTPLWLRALSALTWRARRRVHVMEVIGEDQRRRLLAGGIAPERIEIRRDPSPVTIAADQKPADVPEVLKGRKVVLYSGNWGVAHDYETFAVGMALFEQAHPGVAGVWINATSDRAMQAHKALTAVGVPAAITAPCALSDLPAVLVAADVHLITLLDAFVGYVLPSKVYACIESRRPILFIGSENSDVHVLCALANEPDAYQRADVGDAEAVCEALETLLLGD